MGGGSADQGSRYVEFGKGHVLDVSEVRKTVAEDSDLLGAAEERFQQCFRAPGWGLFVERRFACGDFTHCNLELVQFGGLEVDLPRCWVRDLEEIQRSSEVRGPDCSGRRLTIPA